MILDIIDLLSLRINLSKEDMGINRSLQSRQLIKVSLPLPGSPVQRLTTTGKVENVEHATAYKPKNHTPSKIERRNTQKQIQKNKRDEQIKNARFFGGARGAAKIVVHLTYRIF